MFTLKNSADAHEVEVQRSCAFFSADLSGVQLSTSEPRSNSDDFQDTESLELQTGQSDTVIGLQVTGNVPRYNVTCKKYEIFGVKRTFYTKSFM